MTSAACAPTLVSLYDGTVAGRAAILRLVADDQSFSDAEYNRAFVLMEYFGYLRRDPEPGGFDFWLGQPTPGTQRILKSHGNEWHGSPTVNRQ